MSAPRRRVAKKAAGRPARAPAPDVVGVLHVPITEPDMEFHRWNLPGVESVPCEMDELTGYQVGVNPDTFRLNKGWDGKPNGRQLPYDAGTTIRVSRVVDRDPPDPNVRKAPRVVNGGGELLGHIIELDLTSCGSTFRLEKIRGQALRLLVDDVLVYTWRQPGPPAIDDDEPFD